MDSGVLLGLSAAGIVLLVAIVYLGKLGTGQKSEEPASSGSSLDELPPMDFVEGHNPGKKAEDPAVRRLGERYAAGEIDESDYQQIRALLDADDHGS